MQQVSSDKPNLKLPTGNTNYAVATLYKKYIELTKETPEEVTTKDFIQGLIGKTATLKYVEKQYGGKTHFKNEIENLE